MLQWIINNLLTESQLDVVPPGQTKPLRDLSAGSAEIEIRRAMIILGQARPVRYANAIIEVEGILRDVLKRGV